MTYTKFRITVVMEKSTAEWTVTDAERTAVEKDIIRCLSEDYWIVPGDPDSIIITSSKVESVKVRGIV